MPVVEILKFRPASGVTEADFLAANDRFEQEYMKGRHGFHKRTLLRGEGGEWIVVVDWNTPEDAQASMDAFPNDPAAAPFTALLEPGTLEMKRFAVARAFRG